MVPPILAFRRDCTYGDLAAMRLPEDDQGVSTCEVCLKILFCRFILSVFSDLHIHLFFF